MQFSIISASANNRKIDPHILISIILFISILSCLSYALEPARGGVLNFGRSGDSVNLDPAAQWDTESTKVAACIFESLVRYKPGSTDIEPALATSWSVSEDGKLWTFNLRKGVKFHDGSTFDEAAVVFSFKRQMDTNHPLHYCDFNWWNSTMDMVEDVIISSEMKVQFKLSRPYAPFLANMAMPCAAIVSPAAASVHGREFSNNPCGTGPFMMEKWIKNDRIILKTNNDYWGEKPYLDGIVYHTIQDNNSRLLALRSGTLDVIDGILPKDAPLIKRTSGIVLLEEPGLNISYIAMNNARPPFNDVRVRRAVNLAINKTPLVRIFFQRAAIPAVNPMPPSIWGYNDDISDYEYNPSAARKLLTDAGYPDGITAEILIMPIGRPYCPEPMNLARAISRSLSGAGINLSIVMSPTWEQYLEDTDFSRFQMALAGWVGDNADPDNFLYVLLAQQNAVEPPRSNAAIYVNEEVSNLLYNAQTKFSQKERVPLYMKAQEKILQDAPWVPLAHVNDMVALQSSVKGFKISPTGLNRLDLVWIEKR